MEMSKKEALRWDICRQHHVFFQGHDVLGAPVASYFTQEEFYFYLLAKHNAADSMVA